MLYVFSDGRDPQVENRCLYLGGSPHHLVSFHLSIRHRGTLGHRREPAPHLQSLEGAVDVRAGAPPRGGALQAEVKSEARLRSLGGERGLWRGRPGGGGGVGGDGASKFNPRKEASLAVFAPCGAPSPSRSSRPRTPQKRVLKVMNPVYSPSSSGVPYTNAKGIGYPAGFPMSYAAAAPAYSPNMYPGANPTFQTGLPLKVVDFSSWVNTLSNQLGLFIVVFKDVYRMTLQLIKPSGQCEKQGTFYTQHLYAAPPHVIHHTTVVQPNGMPATMYPAPIPPPRGNGVTMGMVAGTTMAMSAGTLLTAHSPTPVAPHPVTVPTYRGPGTPTYSYVPPQW
ncbi:myelin-associated neurite-outgrowth inhibitor isoform X2 [Myotis lucifugus]|uniref:myelin-associated neurite-outgrowth inhibitor isoform X2 n=1 Tax=Myotis lucifugus TaxID=59463 RepID=UPI000CCC058F|nr:myelin-associated neurite-outgrowth inhibitor isoform X2 [Myotis lucifugus]